MSDDEKMLVMIKPIDDAFARYQFFIYFEEDVVNIAMSLPQEIRDLLLGYLYMSSQKNGKHSSFISKVETELLLSPDIGESNEGFVAWLNEESKAFLAMPIQLEFFDAYTDPAGTPAGKELSIDSPELLKKALKGFLPAKLSLEISKDNVSALAIISAANQMKKFNPEMHDKFVASLKEYMAMDDTSNTNDKLTLFWNHWFDMLQGIMAKQDGISIEVEDEMDRRTNSHTIEIWIDNLSDVLAKTKIKDVHMIHELLLHLSHTYYTNRLFLSDNILKTNHTLSYLSDLVDKVKNEIDISDDIEGIKGLAMLSLAANDNITESMLKEMLHGTKEFYNLHFIKLLSVVHGSSISFLKRVRLQADAIASAGMAMLIAEDFEIARNKADKREIAISLLEGAVHSTHSSEQEIAKYKGAIAHLLTEPAPKKPKKERWVIPKGFTTSLTNMFLSPAVEEVNEEVCETVQSYS